MNVEQNTSASPSRPPKPPRPIQAGRLSSIPPAASSRTLSQSATSTVSADTTASSVAAEPESRSSLRRSAVAQPLDVPKAGTVHTPTTATGEAVATSGSKKPSVPPGLGLDSKVRNGNEEVASGNDAEYSPVSAAADRGSVVNDSVTVAKAPAPAKQVSIGPTSKPSSDVSASTGNGRAEEAKRSSSSQGNKAATTGNNAEIGDAAPSKLDASPVLSEQVKKAGTGAGAGVGPVVAASRLKESTAEAPSEKESAPAEDAHTRTANAVTKRSQAASEVPVRRADGKGQRSHSESSYVTGLADTNRESDADRSSKQTVEPVSEADSKHTVKASGGKKTRKKNRKAKSRERKAQKRRDKRRLASKEQEEFIAEETARQAKASTEAELQDQVEPNRQQRSGRSSTSKQHLAPAKAGAPMTSAEPLAATPLARAASALQPRQSGQVPPLAVFAAVAVALVVLALVIF